MLIKCFKLSNSLFITGILESHQKVDIHFTTIWYTYTYLFMHMYMFAPDTGAGNLTQLLYESNKYLNH